MLLTMKIFIKWFFAICSRMVLSILFLVILLSSSRISSTTIQVYSFDLNHHNHIQILTRSTWKRTKILLQAQSQTDTNSRKEDEYDEDGMNGNTLTTTSNIKVMEEQEPEGEEGGMLLEEVIDDILPIDQEEIMKKMSESVPSKQEIMSAISENGMGRLDNERLRSRIVMNRSYARSGPFTKQNLKQRPTIDDLLPIPYAVTESFYVTIPARVLTVLGSAFLFPYIIQFLDPCLGSMSPNDLNDIVSNFVPSIGLLYSAMIAFTLSNLYTRQQNIQDAVARESALLSIVTKNLLSLFKKDKDLMIDAGNCVAKQVTALVKNSRGEELLRMIYNDPYGRIVDLIDAEEERIENRKGNFQRKGQLLANCRDLINQLAEIRATRISQEANALSETHFTFLNSLTVMILFGYIISVLPTIESTTGTGFNVFGFGNIGEIINSSGDKVGSSPFNTASLLFGGLTSIYSSFYWFARDLNEPFSGAYQLRRSASATHLLQIKWNLVNHPWLEDVVDFDDDDCGGDISNAL